MIKNKFPLLIKTAQKIAKKRELTRDATIGRVGCTMLTESGNIIPPCGRCRELMYQIDRILSKDKFLTLDELLPHRWQDYWVGREQVWWGVIY